MNMMSKRRHAILAALAGTMLSVVVARPAFAADDAPATNGTPDDPGTIVVTALKRTQNLQDVPATVSVLSQQTLETQKIQRFEDVAAVTPGLSVANQGAGRNILTIRGVTSGSGQFTNSVGVYLDDIPVGSSNADNNGAADTGDFDTFDMSRIEVLQGPQGTLYGTNALGGLIRYITNQPSTDSLTGKLEVGDVGVAHGANGLSLKGEVNIPLSDKTAIRVSGFRRIDPGYADNVGPYFKKDNQNKDKFEGGRFALMTKPTDRLTITLTGYYAHVASAGDNQIDLDPVTLRPAFGDYERNHNFPESYNSKYALGALTIVEDLDWAKLTSITSYSSMRNHQNYDFSPFYGKFAVNYGLTPDTFGTLAITLASTKKVTQEVRLASEGTSKLDWQIGGFLDHEDSLFAYVAAPFDLPTGARLSGTPVGGSHNPSVYRDLAAFANVIYHFTPSIDLTVGGRFNNNDQHFTPEQIISLRFPTGLSKVGNSNENAVTFLASPSWKISSNAMVYVRIAKGYRAGGPNALPPGAPASVPETYKADNLISYEGGAKLSAWDKKLIFDGSIYHIDWNNIQLSTEVDGLGVNGNGAKAYIDGAEAMVSLTPVKAFTVSGNINYNHARLGADAPDVGGLKGDELPNVPAWAGSVTAQLNEPLTQDIKGTAAAVYSYSGSRYSDYSENGRVKMPSYSTVNLQVGAEYKNYSLSLIVRNALDKRGYTNIEPIATYSSGFLIQPRTIGIYGTVNF